MFLDDQVLLLGISGSVIFEPLLDTALRLFDLLRLRPVSIHEAVRGESKDPSRTIDKTIARELDAIRIEQA